VVTVSSELFRHDAFSVGRTGSIRFQSFRWSSRTWAFVCCFLCDELLFDKGVSVRGVNVIADLRPEGNECLSELEQVITTEQNTCMLELARSNIRKQL